MKDVQRAENAAAAQQARDAAGHPHTAGTQARLVDAALRRYLAAETYREEQHADRPDDDVDAG
jgi:hypothetical protein